MDRSKRSNNTWGAKQFKKMFENGKISFDHPIQRKGEQWESFKKSLFINSMAEGYPIPAFYALKEDGIYYVLDGKQRLTTVISFLNNEFPLHEETPDVDGYEMAERLFSELSEELQDEIKDCSFTIYSYEDISYEEIEDIFFRLNSGEPLSNIQIAKSKLGIHLSEQMSKLTNHPLFKDKISFTDNQIKKEEDLKVIAEFMMLLDKDYKMTKAGFTPTEVTRYVSKLRDKTDAAEDFISTTAKVFDYLNSVIQSPNKMFLKPTNLPMLFNVAHYSIENDIPEKDFKAWYDSFVEELKAKEVEEQSSLIRQYKEFGGSGSKKPEKIQGRVDTLIESLIDFVTHD